MMRLAMLVVSMLLLLAAVPCGAQRPGGRVLIVVVDGLRPDYVTAELMPNLNRLAEGGVRGMRHHAVFPTVTRVNGPSIFTGRYPGGHGLLGNSVYLPAVDPARILSAADVEDLWAIDRASGGRLLTTPSLGELLAERGLVFFAASSGSTGSGTLMNHRGAGGGLVHHAVTVPDTLGPIVRQVLGPVPQIADGGDEIALAARAVDAVLRIGLDRADADVLAVWLTEPDGTAHAHGIGAPRTAAVLRAVDREIARLLDGFRERGLLEHTNLLVTSDHGFSTRTGKQSVEDVLIAAGLKKSEDSFDVVVAGEAIHVREGGPERVAAIVRTLQQTPWIGPVFTKARTPGDVLGTVPGTLSFETVGWAHARSADILTSGDWSDAANGHGWRGEALTPGVAGHGTSSPWDIRATFIAAGPDVRQGIVSDVPTGNVDITPTALHLAGVHDARGFDGRVLVEILRSGPDPQSIPVASDSVEAEIALPGFTYRMIVNRSRVEGTVYFDGTRVERTRTAAGSR